MSDTRPKALAGVTYQAETGCGKMYVTINPSAGFPEIFIHLGKAGGCAAAQNQSIGRLSATVLRLGGSLEMIIKELQGTKCHRAPSCADTLADVLAKHCGGYEKKKGAEKYEPA